MSAMENAAQAKRVSGHQAYIHLSQDSLGLEKVYAPYVYAGTGTSVSPASEGAVPIRTTSNPARNHYKSVLTSPSQALVLHPTPAQNLMLIREVLKPSVLELASLFGVSRQAVHAWQTGAQPNAESEEKLAVLAQAAKVFADSGVTVDAQTLHRKVGGSETLLRAVLTGADAIQLARALVETLRREGSQRAQLSRQLAGRAPPPVRVDDYGSPALPSDD
ncbi:hypothetical protein LJR289_004358 [Pseudoduganella sp. LjRoot289]|uniref:hypothetical protein n=1 Tax=Pseudoduganella sp. LjRoot289 TaxID=3342314 RepID=UPI003ECC281E